MDTVQVDITKIDLIGSISSNIVDYYYRGQSQYNCGVPVNDPKLKRHG